MTYFLADRINSTKVTLGQTYNAKSSQIFREIFNLLNSALDFILETLLFIRLELHNPKEVTNGVVCKIFEGKHLVSPIKYLKNPNIT